MNENRLNLLKKYYEEDPHDPFNIYAIAMEYINSDTAKAKEYFNILLNKHPEYLPTYYHAAELYANSGDKDLAENIFVRGIELAKKQNNLKTLRELQTSYNNFLFDEDD